VAAGIFVAMKSGPNWEALAARVEAAAVRGAAAGAAVLDEHLPVLAEQLRSVRAMPWLLDYWGASRNHDENVGLRIVEPGALKVIAHLARHRLPVRACHSGLLHTYGYLFSTIRTPFGCKRDRWVEPTVERGLGLRDVLRPMPRQGSLLHNATWWFARVAWSDDARLRRRLERTVEGVAGDVLDYDYRKLRVTRITERVRLPDRRLVELHSELVAFPHANQRGPQALLIYWYRTTAHGRRLMTAFPVFADAVRELRARARGRAPVEVRPRYNALVDGFDEARSGRCTTTTRTA